VKSCNRCDNKFDPKVSYQIYCSEICREEATKEKIAERYMVVRRQKRIGKKRMCHGGCGVKLSIYNDDGFCANCNVSKKAVDKTLKQIKGYLNND
jgi:hypothetical protein